MTHPPATPDDPGKGGESAEWDREEVKRTWMGDLSINALAGEAVLTATMTTTETFRLRIPREKLEALITDLDWAKHRLDPWPEKLR